MDRLKSQSHVRYTYLITLSINLSILIHIQILFTHLYLAQRLQSIQYADCSAENATTILVPFERFLKNLVDTYNEKQKSEEENIMANFKS